MLDVDVKVGSWFWAGGSGHHHLIPVVHQYVRLPEVARRNSDVFDIVVLRHIPPHVAVSPLLRSDRELRQCFKTDELYIEEK